MRNSLLTFCALSAIVFLTASCENEKYPYSAAATFDSLQQLELKYEIIRFIEHTPKKATYETKFDSTFDDYYLDKAINLEFDLYYFDSLNNRNYFSMSRIAPSLYVKKVATGGYWVRDEQDSIAEYVEVYRTWKMLPEELEKKGSLLFQKMISGEDISKYYPQNSKDEWIEFPVDKVHYVPEKRKWELKKQ
jgi:hypothetical protein